MCGIIGVVGKGLVNQTLYDGLTIIQHRGQDAAGIVTCDNERLYLRKNNGLVRLWTPATVSFYREKGMAEPDEATLAKPN